MRLNKVVIVGGGPAGLYFAILLKARQPDCDVLIYERDSAGQTFGWGVVFSGRTLGGLREADAESAALLAAQLYEWDNVDIVHRDEKISIHGNHFAGVARIEMLLALQARCGHLGVDVRFETEVDGFTDAAQFEGAELIIAADGVGSRLRAQLDFGSDVSKRPNRYIWYGTKHLFQGLTLTFRRTNAGIFAAHSYKFSPDTSTFIVECDPLTFERAGLANMSENDVRQLLENIFKADLSGAPLLSNRSRWVNFNLVKNARWHTAVNGTPVVLLGDAAHTAHFSIGSGTKLAIESAIALASALEGQGTVEDGLRRFQAQRKPQVDRYQAMAHKSLVWFENLDQVIDLEPLALAYSAMMRSGRLSLPQLRTRDAAFVERLERELGVEVR